jgi:hypothetical protein
VDEQRRHWCFELHRREPESIDEVLLIQPGDVVAEGKNVAR